MAVYQVAHLQLTHRYRRQASSHIFLPCVPIQTPHNLWEPGLPAMAVYQVAHLQRTHRYRRQASSHS